MVNNSSIIEVPEYKSIKIEPLSDREIEYLRQDCFNYREEGKSPYKVRRLKEKDEIENTSYSGIIQLDNFRIHFSTKVSTNLFYMLTFLKDEKAFLYDSERIIEIKEGECFFDIIGRLFLNELEKIFERGFYKRYVRKEENLAFLKGKLLIKHQIRNDFTRRPEFYCSYEDLTYDNLENRIILRAATLLIPLIRFNEEIKGDLLKYTHLLREEVSLIDVNPEDCNRIRFHRLNDYYEAIIQLSKVILQYHFIRHTQKGLSKGFNFIVNMNRVYEDFITSVIEDIVSTDEEFQDFVVEKQARFDSLVRERTIITRPDIILRRKNTEEYPVIIDAKYKREEDNTDYYQVIAYAMAIPTAKVCCLIYPAEEERIETRILTLKRKAFDSAREDVRLHAIKINLFWEEKTGFKDYITKVKRELKGELLNVVEFH
jgi:5-methylcytosine-specific restriction enzyme subunit McrC